MLIGALVGVQLFGFVGIVIAAPVMASLKLFLNYVINKLNDQNPWEEVEMREPIQPPKWVQAFTERWKRFSDWVARSWRKLWKRGDIAGGEESKEDEEPQADD